ncbi:hypothetical protein LCGC14_2433540 [marine sediment metagenome]|uniref:Uncharacterized protein n=1 Tax=marine sediment metagenome TaxID=412755 RepID=A0A0F9DY55_9ZZZZ
MNWFSSSMQNLDNWFYSNWDSGMDMILFLPILIILLVFVLIIYYGDCSKGHKGKWVILGGKRCKRCGCKLSEEENEHKKVDR